MLSLIGLGLNPRQLTLEALHAIQACRKVYVETYTSKYAQGELHELEGIVHKPVIPLDRSGMEDGVEGLLEEAKTKHIGILIFGNPLTATTHIATIQACKEQNIPYQVLPGISVFNYRGICGLDEYRFGRTTTFVFPQEGHEPLSPFDMIVKNKEVGLHTHCLFDLHPEKQRFMRVDEAISFILKAGDARGVIVHDWIAVGLGSVGNAQQMVHAGRLKELQKLEWNVYPQSLIVCGNLNAFEQDALKVLGGWKG